MPVSALPSINIRFLHTVFDLMRELGCPDAEMASQLFLSPEQIKDSNTQVPANVVYGFLAWAAERSGDRFFLVRCGQRMAAGHWAPVVPLFAVSRSVGEFFVRFAALVSDQGGAANYRLEVEGKIALWRLSRKKVAAADGVQSDAVAAGFFCEILKQAAGADWDPVKAVLVLPDAALVPQDLLPTSSVFSGGEGMSLKFPSDFLFCALGEVENSAMEKSEYPPQAVAIDLESRVEELIEGNLAMTGYGLDQVASSLGMKRWRLQELLRAKGISVSDIKNRIRRRVAVRRVEQGTDSIRQIASELGYSNRTNFTRAFRSWTGLSPRAFRNTRKQGRPDP